MLLGSARYMVGLLGLVAGLCLLSGLADAQAPVKPKAKEEVEDPSRGKKAKPKEEEETKPRPTGKTPIRVPGDEVEATAPKSPAQSSSLDEESRRSPYAEVRTLFKSLIPAGDILTQPSGITIVVDPVAELVPPGAKVPQGITVTPRERRSGISREPIKLNNLNAKSLQSFEQAVLDREKNFRELNLDQEPQGSFRYVPRLEVLRAAEKTLAAGIVYHRIAKTQQKRNGEEWAALDRQLKDRLVQVQAEQLHLLVDQAVEKKDWKPAFALDQALTNAYAGSSSSMPDKLRAEATRLLARHAESALEADDLDELARRLHILRERFPANTEAEKILSSERASKSLAAKLAQVKSDYEAGKKEVARARLRVIEEVNPRLPGLRALETQLNDQVLYVGVTTLPKELLPARARNEAEKQALELLFESLVRIRSTPGRERYEPELALEMPSITPLGRRFTLPRNARWCNGKQVMASDVSSTLNLLRQAKGRDSEWARLMEGAPYVEDSEHITLTMRQGYIDPLAFMDFKILPEPSADKPGEVVGSGPFQFKAVEGEQVVFEANPFYRERPGKEGKPRIREVRFFVSSDPAAEFRQGRLHLLFDLTTGAFKKLEDAGLGELVVTQQIRNRRIWFLAVNHRDNNLPLQSDVFRRGLANAIKREEILDKCFREDHKSAHRELRGPYPPGSWPSKPDLQPYSAGKAASLISQAKQKMAKQTELTLKYPEGDPAVDSACKLIKQQIEAIDPPAILIKLVPLSPDALRRDVEDEHNYHLAYYSYDFPNLDFRLQPLFDPKAVDKGQSNFLGYKGDAELSGFLQEMQVHRDITQVTRAAHELQNRFWEMMPFIPLWQIDTCLAVHNSLRFGDSVDMQTALDNIDPHAIFEGADSWFIERK